jgi:glutamate racemase
VASLADQADFVCQPCDGLADAIEHEEVTKTDLLCQQYTQALGQFGSQDGEIDTLVLGCTHYPLAANVLRPLIGPCVQLIDNGGPVARQTRRLLPSHTNNEAAGQCRLLSTGDAGLVQRAARHWLGLDGPVQALAL